MKHFILMALLFCFSVGLQAETWNVDNQASQVNFISVKKRDAAEVHRFTQVEGRLSETGFELSIPLKSVQTNIEIRDQRMQSMLFEVAKFPELKLTAQIKSKMVDSMVIGQRQVLSVPAKISLHGFVQSMTIDVVIAKLSDQQVMATSLQPIIVSADGFGLGEGIEKLRQIASLSSISWAVPVTFVLVLNK
ncbi:YceI family protein [Shewanella gelidii]|uniref:Lipid/polyisoprenoid-binding YceI-like domain-containing protein n=1 Tax=Shewanella gelidii TaxID=1642821 RepID=A0A917NE72_9GAMM|nr:YceI family protein [Shewanella gelidii]MCL1098979.1 YceI family protein [Shewanella gelidii]GGI89165.1 hypothetical protein GCM10009332_28170 [Shewanella gelidii]